MQGTEATVSITFEQSIGVTNNRRSGRSVAVSVLYSDSLSLLLVNHHHHHHHPNNEDVLCRIIKLDVNLQFNPIRPSEICVNKPIKCLEDPSKCDMGGTIQ